MLFGSALKSEAVCLLRAFTQTLCHYFIGSRGSHTGTPCTPLCGNVPFSPGSGPDGPPQNLCQPLLWRDIFWVDKVYHGCNGIDNLAVSPWQECPHFFADVWWFLTIVLSESLMFYLSAAEVKRNGGKKEVQLPCAHIILHTSRAKVAEEELSDKVWEIADAPASGSILVSPCQGSGRRGDGHAENNTTDNRRTTAHTLLRHVFAHIVQSSKFNRRLINADFSSKIKWYHSMDLLPKSSFWSHFDVVTSLKFRMTRTFL